jgi:hypothetical protein
MTSRPPPVPPANRPKAGTAGEPAAVKGSSIPNKAEQIDNADKRGQSANTKINTTHQGYQQDRENAGQAHSY